MKEVYPRITSLGIPINSGCVRWDDVTPQLNKLGIREKFGKLFGIQTQTIYGPFASDVEAVLERIMSGRLTGSQLFWD